MSSQVGRLAAHDAVSVGATSAVIAARRAGRKSIIVYNNHATQILYIGSSSAVTTANGLPVAAGQSRVLDDYNGALYGIASGAATDVRFFEVY